MPGQPPRNGKPPRVAVLSTEEDALGRGPVRVVAPQARARVPRVAAGVAAAVRFSLVFRPPLRSFSEGTSLAFWSLFEVTFGEPNGCFFQRADGNAPVFE